MRKRAVGECATAGKWLTARGGGGDADDDADYEGMSPLERPPKSSDLSERKYRDLYERKYRDRDLL